jgi:hypothetical protein
VEAPPLAAQIVLHQLLVEQVEVLQVIQVEALVIYMLQAVEQLELLLLV